MMTPEKPWLIFDGDCRFCRQAVAGWSRRVGDAVAFHPWQEVAVRFPEIPPEDHRSFVHLVLPDGRIFTGAEAVFRLLAFAPGGGAGLWCYRKVPGFAAVSRWGYSTVARNRSVLSRLSGWFGGAPEGAPTYFIVRRIFLSGLGIVYALAFFSLWAQIKGLIGVDGIVSAAGFLDSIRPHADSWIVLKLPTLFWLNASDPALEGLCLAGVLLGVLGAFRMMAWPVFALLWVFYLSIVQVGGDFLRFQWDVLLLEAGFLAIFFCPFRVFCNRNNEPPPSVLVLFLLRWLLFRLMFLSGVVKLASGDPAWWNLDALLYHYETQPLPSWIGWYAHQLPAGFQKFSALMMFGIELVVPFFIFLPRRFRQFAFWVFSGFQLLIILTGNYCYFNWLSILLGVTLLDDAFFIRKKQPQAPVPAPGLRLREPRFKLWLVRGLAVVIVLTSGVYFFRTLYREAPIPAFINQVVRWQAPFHMANPYGLFSVMTTERFEIVVEGSNDGKTWQAYEFKWKPGDVDRAPAFVAPHQPRLDWQMWFAALAGYKSSPWLVQLMIRLLRGQPEVVALLETNPFQASPPLYMRAMLYKYRFTSPEERESSGAWWKRELKGRFTPYIKLRETAWPDEGLQT